MENKIVKISVILSVISLVVSLVAVVVSRVILGGVYTSDTTQPVIIVSSEVASSSFSNALTVGSSTLVNNVAPTSTFPNTMLGIDTNLATLKGLVIRGVTSQSANLQEWLTGSGATVAYMDVSGNLSASGTLALVGSTTTTIKLSGRLCIEGKAATGSLYHVIVNASGALEVLGGQCQ